MRIDEIDSVVVLPSHQTHLYPILSYQRCIMHVPQCRYQYHLIYNLQYPDAVPPRALQHNVPILKIAVRTTPEFSNPARSYNIQIFITAYIHGYHNTQINPQFTSILLYVPNIIHTLMRNNTVTKEKQEEPAPSAQPAIRFRCLIPLQPPRLPLWRIVFWRVVVRLCLPFMVFFGWRVVVRFRYGFIFPTNF